MAAQTMEDRSRSGRLNYLNNFDDPSVVFIGLTAANKFNYTVLTRCAISGLKRWIAVDLPQTIQNIREVTGQCNAEPSITIIYAAKPELSIYWLHLFYMPSMVP